MPESGRGGGGKGEKASTYTHAHTYIDTHTHTHSHTNTSHTFRRGRRRADMKSYHLKRKRGEAEREEGEKEGAKKKICSTLLSIMCVLRERAGRMPWSVEEAEKCTNRPPTLHFSYSIDTHAAPELYPAPKMRFYYSVELYTAA